MDKPTNPTCQEEVQYWYNLCKAGGEDAEKASRKLKCYYENCKNRGGSDSVMFKWCCRSHVATLDAATGEELNELLSLSESYLKQTN